MNIFARRKILRHINATELIPVRVVGHAVADGRVVLQIPKFESRIIHLLSPSTQKLFFRVKLDEVGSKVWESIDGSRSVGEIAGLVRSEMTLSDTWDDLVIRLNKFTSQLYENRYITFKQLIDKQ